MESKEFHSFSLVYACMLRFQEFPKMFMEVCCFSELLFWAGVKILPQTSVVASSKVRMQWYKGSSAGYHIYYVLCT